MLYNGIMNLQDARKSAYTKSQSGGGSGGNFNKEFRNTSSGTSYNSSAAAPYTPSSINDDNGLVKEVSKDSVYRRVAKFLMLIGTDEAARVLRLLSDEQTQRIIPEIATIRSISDDEKVAILTEFQELYKSVSAGGGPNVAFNILSQVYGAEKANEMLQKARPYIKTKPFEYLNNETPKRISQILKDESNATKCLVLTSIDPKKAAAIISAMDLADKKDVVVRLAKMEAVSPEVLQKVDKALFDKLKTIGEEGEELDGREKLTQILKIMDPSAGGDIINLLERDDEELGHEIRARLFTIDDVVNADVKYIQERLHSMQTNDIAKLIIKKPEEFRDKILSCISQGRRKEVIDEEQYGTFLKSDCERVTNDFIMKLREDFEKGKFVVTGRNDDVFV